MSTRCLFKLSAINEYESCYEYRLVPVYGGEENKAYWEYTPSGSLNLTILKKLGKLFNFNEEYYLDISPKV